MKLTPDYNNKGGWIIQYQDVDGYVTEYCRHHELDSVVKRIEEEEKKRCLYIRSV